MATRFKIFWRSLPNPNPTPNSNPNPNPHLKGFSLPRPFIGSPMKTPLPSPFSFMHLVFSLQTLKSPSPLLASPLKVDPRYGTRQDLRDLCDAAHKLGMYVLLD